MRLRVLIITIVACCIVLRLSAQPKHEITISGRSFQMDGAPFPYTGISFFNAIHNRAFNTNSTERRHWMEKFQRYGINVLRVWAQWDNGRVHVDICPECSLYFPDGRLREEHVARLKEIVADADSLGIVIELTLFAHQSWEKNVRLGPAESARALTSLASELMPYRNLTFQIWNEFSERTLDHLRTIKAIDPKRLVTNSPGGSGELGDAAQNQLLDYLTPHTTRQNSGRHWEIVPAEIAYLLARYGKPVVDDEPARNGVPDFGGPHDATYPFDQILQIYQVWRLGAYINYHHDMFQTGYGTPPVPPNGIPDPEFSLYHRLVLEFISHRDRYQPAH
jgi:hypothetical protein